MHKDFKNIETKRLILRKFKESDIEKFFDYRTKPQVAIYQGEGWDQYTLKQAVEFVNNQMYSQPGIPDAWFQIAVELKENGELIGDCGIHTLQDLSQVEIGFTLDPMYQNRGYAREAVRCLIDYLFSELKLHRVIAITDVRNINSIKLLEKIGMRKEAHFIKNARYRGEYTDEYLYAILQEEWHKSR